jgi:hypothetical protein
MTKKSPSQEIIEKITEEGRRLAPVLERMVEILGSEDSTPMSAALLRASAELAIEVPADMEGPIYVAAYRVITSGGIPGAAEA